LALLATLALAAPASATDLNYPDFSSTTGLTLNGSAVQNGNVLQLTPAENDKTGSVFTSAALNPQESFSTKFALSMHDSTTFPLPADGMAFVVQSKGPQGGDGLGGSLGFGEIKPSVAVEFDIFENFPSDPPGDHISVVSEGDVSTHLACANAGPTPPCTAILPFALYGALVYAWVEYDAATQHLKVFAGQTGEKPATPLIDYQISLAPLGTSSYAGFTAATGASNAVHDLLSWNFDQADPTPIAAPHAKKAKKCPVHKGKKHKGQHKGKGKKAGASKAKGKKVKGKKGKGKKCGHKNKGKNKGKGKGKGRS
jgi:hypothetical protein